jgi:hypothetical protein
MPLLVKLILSLLIIGGVLWLVRLRLGLFILLILLPGLVLGSVGVVFFAAAYLVIASVLLCTLFLAYVVFRALLPPKSSPETIH